MCVILMIEYIYIHYPCVYLWRCARACVYVCVCVCVCVCMCVCVCLCVCVCVCILICIYIYVCMCVFLCIHVYVSVLQMCFCIGQHTIYHFLQSSHELIKTEHSLPILTHSYIVKYNNVHCTVNNIHHCTVYNGIQYTLYNHMCTIH